MEALPPLEAFKFLGRTITYNNINWAAVYQNLQKYWRRWGMIARVLESTGITVRSRGAMYKAVAQSVLLYGRKSWVGTKKILKFLEMFHHRSVRQITVLTAKCGAGGEW